MKMLFFAIYLLNYGNCQNKLFPDISDLFQTFNEDPFDINSLQKHGIYTRNISLDVEKLNISELQSKWNLENMYNDTTGVDINDTRRINWANAGSKWQYRHATKINYKIKCVDVMLQVIYMARHKLKQLESQKFFNPKDTSYRIAFLYRRIRRIWKKIMDIFSTMAHNRKKWWHPWDSIDPFLILHHKAAKKHVDFLYLWWVQVKLHEKYCETHGVPNIIPNWAHGLE